MLSTAKYVGGLWPVLGQDRRNATLVINIHEPQVEEGYSLRHNRQGCAPTANIKQEPLRPRYGNSVVATR